jgi:hypothetical protein
MVCVVGGRGQTTSWEPALNSYQLFIRLVGCWYTHARLMVSHPGQQLLRIGGGILPASGYWPQGHRNKHCREQIYILQWVCILESLSIEQELQRIRIIMRDVLVFTTK